MNAFDFSNLSDIAETNPELAKNVANPAQDKINAVVGVFKQGAEAGVNVLTKAELQVAAIRLGLAIANVTGATLLKYINTAVEQGALKKVTRQSYALADADVEVEADANEPEPEQGEGEAQEPSDAPADDLNELEGI